MYHQQQEQQTAMNQNFANQNVVNLQQLISLMQNNSKQPAQGQSFHGPTATTSQTQPPHVFGQGFLQAAQILAQTQSYVITGGRAQNQANQSNIMNGLQQTGHSFNPRSSINILPSQSSQPMGGPSFSASVPPRQCSIPSARKNFEVTGQTQSSTHDMNVGEMYPSLTQQYQQRQMEEARLQQMQNPLTQINFNALSSFQGQPADQQYWNRQTQPGGYPNKAYFHGPSPHITEPNSGVMPSSSGNLRHSPSRFSLRADDQTLNKENQFTGQRYYDNHRNASQIDLGGNDQKNGQSKFLNAFKNEKMKRNDEIGVNRSADNRHDMQKNKSTSWLHARNQKRSHADYPTTPKSGTLPHNATLVSHVQQPSIMHPDQSVLIKGDSLERVNRYDNTFTEDRPLANSRFVKSQDHHHMKQPKSKQPQSSNIMKTQLTREIEYDQAISSFQNQNSSFDFANQNKNVQACQQPESGCRVKGAREMQNSQGSRMKNQGSGNKMVENDHSHACDDSLVHNHNNTSFNNQNRTVDTRDSGGEAFQRIPIKNPFDDVPIPAASNGRKKTFEELLEEELANERAKNKKAQAPKIAEKERKGSASDSKKTFLKRKNEQKSASKAQNLASSNKKSYRYYIDNFQKDGVKSKKSSQKKLSSTAKKMAFRSKAGIQIGDLDSSFNGFQAHQVFSGRHQDSIQRDNPFDS